MKKIKFIILTFILTLNFSARSAKEAGTVFEFDWTEMLKVKNNVTNINLILLIVNSSYNK